MRIGILFMFIAFSGVLFAQKAKVGIVNRDSVLSSIPGGRAAKDSTNAHKLHVTNTRSRLENELNKKIREADSLKEKSSTLIQQLRQVQIEQMTDNLRQFDYLSAEELKNDSFKLRPFIYAIEEAEIKMVEKYHCAIESEYKNDSREPIYLTNEVIGLLQNNKAVHANPKRIGYVNKDSILSVVYPEFKRSKSTRENEIVLFRDTAEQMVNEYLKKQHAMDSMANESSPLPGQQAELDSLQRRYESKMQQAKKRILGRDSVECAPYYAKYYKVWTDIMKQGEFFYVYDSKDDLLAWKAEEADLINLNRDFATKLE